MTLRAAAARRRQALGLWSSADRAFCIPSAMLTLTKETIIDRFKDVWGFYWSPSGQLYYHHLWMTDLTGRDDDDEIPLMEARRLLAEELTRVYDIPVPADEIRTITRNMERVPA